MIKSNNRTNQKPTNRCRTAKAAWAILCIMIFSIFLQGVEALSWSNTTFNNSLTTENLTFSGNENITRWLAVPESVSHIINAFLNLSGNGPTAYYWGVNITDNMFDNFNRANAEVVGNGWQEGYDINITGNRLMILTHDGTATEFNRNYSDISDNVKGVEVFVNMSSFIGELGFLIIIKSSGGTVGPAVEFERFSYNITAGGDTVIGSWAENQTVKITLKNIDAVLDTYDVWVDDVLKITGKAFNHPLSNTFLLNLRAAVDGTGFIWLDNITLSNTVSYPANASIEIGVPDGTHEWNYTGRFDQTNNRTSNLASAINSYLSGCSIVGGNCLVPFLFHSDTIGILQYLDMFFNNEGFLENSQTFQSSIFDTSRETFKINITFDSIRYSDITTTLVYNNGRITGTSSANGDERVFSAVKDIEVVSSNTNNTFHWEIALTDISGQTVFNSTFKNQTVSPSNLIQCGAGSRAINYTTYDENDQSLLVTEFDATFGWRLNESSSVTKNVSVSLSGANNYQFCINANSIFFTDVDINLDSDGFTTRTFGFNSQEFSNITTHQQLYLLNESLGTDFILKLKDVGLFPLADHTLQVFRKLASGGEILVENDITDHIGQIVARVIENEIKYMILFFDEDNVLVKTIPNAIFTCTQTICQQTFIVQELTGAFDDFDDLEDHTSSLTFNNNTRTFTFVWVDNRGESQTHRMLVEKITFANGTQAVYNGTSTSNSGVLSYTADTSRASYRVSAFRSVGINEDRLFVLNEGIGDNASTFSFEGLYWSFILFMIMLLVGRFNPPTGVILYLFSVFMLGIFGIVFVNPAIMIASLVIGVIFIWAWRG